jgi:hypothetical protein
MQIFARLTKVNEADRTVEGIIASEAVDRSGEVFDYEKSVPHFKAWSENIAKATEGKNLGNVRVMHGNAVAGVTKVLNFDDAAKQITVKAEIVDENEWKKVQKGCYTGFSIGGKYGDKWDDPVLKAKRYEAIPNEYSLVDLPCNPDAQFTVIKADGAEELRKFETSLDNPEALAKWAEGLSDAERAAVLVKIAPAQPVVADDGNAAKSLRQAFAERIAGMEKAAPIVLSLAQLAGKPLEKGMYDVSRLADLLCDLGWLAEDAEWEAQLEGDNSPVPAQLRESVKQLGRVLVAMATEEATELADRMGGAEKADQGGELAKAADELQKALASVDAIGKALGCANGEAPVEKAAALVADLAKVTGERDTAQQALTKATGEIETLKKQVAAPKGPARAIEKTQDNGDLGETLPADPTVRKADGTVDQQATAQALIKRAHANPIRVG